jgi:hypothetical protein
MDEDQRLNFNSFVDAYDAYQNPNLAPVAPAFAGYGYQAPQLNMVQAPSQMPQMMLDPNAIYDPTVGAAMQILNRPMMMAQAPDLLGAGTDYQTQFGLLPNIAPSKLQQYQRIAAPPPPPSLMQSVGGGDYGNYDPYGGMGDIERSNIGIPSTQFEDSIYDYSGNMYSGHDYSSGPGTTSDISDVDTSEGYGGYF